MKETQSMIGGLVFAAFVAGKVAGPLVAWSWWWLLMPLVPVIAWIARIA